MCIIINKLFKIISKAKGHEHQQIHSQTDLNDECIQSLT
jgi:hypothetical protein